MRARRQCAPLKIWRAALSQYAEIKAIASGNPAVVEKIKVDTEIRKLDQLRAVHASQQRHIKWEIRDLPRQIVLPVNSDVAENVIAVKYFFFRVASIDAGASPPPSREHGASVCPATESASWDITKRSTVVVVCVWNRAVCLRGKRLSAASALRLWKKAPQNLTQSEVIICQADLTRKMRQPISRDSDDKQLRKLLGEAPHLAILSQLSGSSRTLNKFAEPPPAPRRSLRATSSLSVRNI